MWVTRLPILILVVVLLLSGYVFPQEVNLDNLINLKQKQETNGREETYIRPKKEEKESTEIEKPYQHKEEEKTLKLSRIEKLYNSIYKDEEKLVQFGYDIFEREVSSLDVPVGSRYVLGPGDELIVYFWGDPVDVLGLKSHYVFEVDREGKIFIPSVGVVYVWNKKVENVKKELRALLSKNSKGLK